MPLRLLHVSDLHFGRSSVAAQVDGVERLWESEKFDAIVVSGDLSQRTRTGEFERARQFVADARRFAPVLVVPGNHDTAWWMAPLGLGSIPAMYARYRKYVSEELEPVLHVPGATIVGLNSAHGIRSFTLTTRPRDLSVVGALREAQWCRARREFDAAPHGRPQGARVSSQPAARRALEPVGAVESRAGHYRVRRRRAPTSSCADTTIRRASNAST